MQLIRTILLAAGVLAAPLSAAEAQDVYVPDWGPTVSVLDATTLAPAGLIPVSAPVSPACPFGGSPDAVQFTHDQRFAFVSIDDCDQIAVIDTGTQTVVKFIQALPGTGETRIFSNPKGDRMYVNTCGMSTVAVIDVKKQQMIGTIALPAGGGTYPMAFSPDGTLGHTGNSFCGGLSDIDRLDLKTNSLLGSIPTSKPVNGLAVSPDGKVALGAADDELLVIDLTTNAEVGAVMGCPGVCAYSFLVGIVFNADGSRAYVIDDGTNELITIDTTNPLSPIELSRTPIASPAFAWELAIFGTRLWVMLADAPSEVVAFDVSTDPPLQLPGVGFAVFGFEIDVQISANQCKQDGWKTLGFSNQGQCVSAIRSQRR